MSLASVLRDLGWRDVGGPRMIRTRTAVVGALGGIVALAVGSLLTMAAVRHSLHEDINDEVHTTLEELEADVKGGIIPVLQFDRQDATVAQVIDADGTVLAASSELVGLRPMTLEKPPAGDEVHRTLSSFRPWTTHPVHIAVRSVDTSDYGLVVIVAGSSLKALEGASQAVLKAALGAGAVLLIGVQLVIWLAVRKALRPVERMSAELASIVDGSDLSRRVELPRYDDEIARLARSMNAMLEELERSYDRQQRFVGDVAHELRSPLSAMRAQLEVALRQSGSAGWEAHVRDALTDEVRLEQLVDNLLLLARFDEGVLPRAATPVDLLDLVETTAAGVPCRPGASIVIDDRGPALVLGDEVQLGIVVRNLLSNACRYATSSVRVAVGPDGDHEATIAVSDDGPGIPAADRERVFERFTRLDPSRARADGRPGGYGLGLAIAREVVTRHHGTITVVGDGPGATFLVRLPALEVGADPANQADAAATLDDEPAPGSALRV